GEPIQSFDSRLSFGGGEVRFDQLRITHDEAHITGNGTYTLATHAFRFNLDGANFDLARIQPLQRGRVSVAARMDFTAQLWRTQQEPAMNATVRLRDLTFDHERAGDFFLDANSQGPELRVKGHSEFELAELSLEGKVRLREDWPSTIDFHFNHLDVDSLFRT